MRAINFSAGPSPLPLPSLEEARAELVDWGGTGMSVMEQSHRGKAYEALHVDARERLARLLGLPDSHQVLFLHGGASLHFALAPLNFLKPGDTADYVLTGIWADKAFEEAQVLGRPRVAASSKDADGQYRRVPADLELEPAAAYVHLTSNNTVEGTQFHAFPDTGPVLQVADMSSDLLSRPLDVRRFGFIYAGAQKNLGPSGIVVALAHREFLARARKDIPRIFRYQTQAEADSLYNTPNTWGVYLIHKVLRWIEAQGSLPGMEARNRQKAQALYSALEGLSGFYALPVEPTSRSLMNVVFRCPDEAQDKRFVAESEAAGLVGLKGHRTVGGLRASLYNAVSQADVEALVSFARDFARRRG